MTMARQESKMKPPMRLAVEMARIACGDNAEDILVLDLRGISPVTDYFVIATGTSSRQLRSIGEEMAQYGKKAGQPAWHVAGHQAGRGGSGWIVLDFVDVVVHLFDASKRAYYDLELIWGEAPRVDWRPSSRRGAGAARQEA